MSPLRRLVIRHREALGAATLVALSFLIISIAAIAGCGASARQKAISATYATVSAVDKAYVDYNKAHESELVAKAAPGQAEADLNNYLARRAPVDKARTDAWKALATATAANDDPSIANAAQAAEAFAKLLKSLGVTP